MRTLPVGLALLSQGAHSIDWGHLMAGAVIASLPVVVAFLVFQRQIISGLTSGMSR
jgi:multiple sugar transport system permease protein